MSSSKTKRLEGKVFVITGGASGIGKACALRFVEEGAKVLIGDLSATRNEQAIAEISEALGAQKDILQAVVDITQEDQIEALADKAMAEFGKIDGLVCAAGIPNADYLKDGDIGKNDAAPVLLLEKTLESWNRVLQVNLTGTMLCGRAIARRMIASGNPGSIINVSSTAGRVPAVGTSDYGVSKAGVEMLTKIFAEELIPHSIRVNVICPGFVETRMTNEMRKDDRMMSIMIKRTPMRRLGTAVEMANAALYLASDESSYTTGQSLFPNGGIFVG